MPPPNDALHAGDAVILPTSMMEANNGLARKQATQQDLDGQRINKLFLTVEYIMNHSTLHHHKHAMQTKALTV